METNEKFNIYIGLLKANMKDSLNEDLVLKLVSKKFLKIGVIGFNCESIKGFWNEKPEPSLKISFINSFGVKEKDILNALKNLKIELEQESILIEKVENVLYSFL
jgi:hypothetical protein